MIHANELVRISVESNAVNRIERWWQLSHEKLNDLLLNKAKLGKRYLHLGQSTLKWMSVPEFREVIKINLSNEGYVVTDTGSNTLKIQW